MTRVDYERPCPRPYDATTVRNGCPAFVTIEGRHVRCSDMHSPSLNPRAKHGARIVSTGGLFVRIEWQGSETR